MRRDSKARPSDREGEFKVCLETLDRLPLPSGEDLWVFGYGSLMWNPGFPFKEVRVARLQGYHRRLCVRSVYYRGTEEAPGLVFGLDRGGSCRGLAYRIPAELSASTLDYLYERELVTLVYRPTRVPLQSAEGALSAVTFVVDRVHDNYAGRLAEEEVAAIVARGQGRTGSNRDYLYRTVVRMESIGIADAKLRQLLEQVETLATQAHLE